MSTLENRLTKLEKVSAAGADVPFLSIPVEDWDRMQDPNTPAEELAELQAKYATSRATKAYIGISPDDWD